MALPTSDRPAAPKPKPPAPVLGDQNAAAQYHARWDTPMPISAGDERRTAPAPAPAAPSRFDPNAVKTAQSILQEALAVQNRSPEQNHAIGMSQLYDNNPATAPAQDGSGRVGAYQLMAQQQGNAPAVPEIAHVDKAEAMLADALRAQREQGLGMNKGGKPVPIRKQVDRMTTDEYNALTPEQRAAVDFNGMLVTAVRKDRKLAGDYMPSPSERETYDKTVDQIFGPDSPGKKYAPETVALLNQIGYNDPTATLSDFLHLRSAVKAKDLKYLADTADQPQTETTMQFFGDPSINTRTTEGLNDPRLDRVTLAKNLATGTEALQRQLAQGQQLLQSMNAMARSDRADAVDLLGGNPSQPAVGLGYQPGNFDANGIPQDVNSYFQLAFDRLANGSADRQAVLDDAKSMLSGQEFQAFLTYADDRSKNSERYNIPLGNTRDGVTYKSPEEFRAMLGLDKKGATGG